MTADTPDQQAEEQAVQEAAEDDAGTASARYRWKWLSTFTTLVVIPGWILLVLTGSLAGLTPRARWLVHLTYAMAVVYALGPGTLRDIQEARNAGGEA